VYTGQQVTVSINRSVVVGHVRKGLRS